MTVLEPLAPGFPETATPRDSERAEAKRPALIVRAGPRLCAFEVQHVVETMRPLPVEALSGAPGVVLGIAVIRGEPIPVVHLGSLVGASEEADLTRFVTLRVGSRRVALAVEGVLGVRDIEAGLLREVPPLLTELEGEGVSAIAIHDEELLLVLRGAGLLSEELWETLASAEVVAENGGPGASAEARRLGDGGAHPTETARRQTPDREGTP